jgi:SH3-like domain-containing protein
MSSEPKITAANAHAYNLGCPHLGLEDDPSTKLLYPSPFGCCHRARPVAAVMLAHQSTHCLSSNYVECPVYVQQKQGALPSALRQPSGERADGRRYGLIGVTGVVITAVIFLTFLWNNGFLNNLLDPQPSISQAEPTALPAVVIVEPTETPTAVATLIPSLTPTNTAVPSPLPSATPAPTTTPLPPTPTGTATRIPIPPSVTIITINNLSIHSEPSQSAPVLLQVGNEPVQFAVVGQNVAGDWWEICCIEEAHGWILVASVLGSEEIVTEEETTAVPITTTDPVQLLVTVPRLNVRTGPGVAYPVLELADEGAVLQAIGRLRDNSWWQVCCTSNGAAGWVYSQSVEVQQGDANSVPIVVDIPPVPTEEAEGG